MARTEIDAQILLGDLESILQYRLKRRDKERIFDAYEFARFHHQEQMRDSGEPFISHPIEVAKILAQFSADNDTIIAGILHDIVEDCNVPLSEIAEKYGDTVALIVDGVTKISNLKLNEKLESKIVKSRMKVETLRKMLLALSDDPRIIIVKLADRLHNMRTLDFLKDPEKKRDKARETLQIYAPIAHRIGMHKIQAELEDLSFKYEYPEEFKELKFKVNRKLKERQDIMDEYKEIVLRELRKNRISALIEGRVKHLYSIWQKMIKKNRSFDEVFDLIALRIVTGDEVNCYKILGAVHSLWPPMPGRFKDYIAAPKSNGYKSLHTTLITHRGEPLEIQIRSERMHKEAEYGVASHWVYKEGIDVKDRTWFTQLVDWQKDFIESFKDMESISRELEVEEVFVFTPKGEVVHLPKGATPIDFAYAIHTEVGHHYAGAKVNDRLVPVNYELQLGDRVEVIVNKASEGPSLDWLKYVRANSTKAKIKRFFKNEYSAKLVERGKEIFRKISKRLAVSMDDLIEGEQIKALMNRLGAHNENDLFSKLGDGSVTMGEVLSLLAPKEEEIETLPEETELIKQKQAKGNEVVVGGETGIAVYFAKCCTPLPGDDIVAVMSSRGISIHTRNCRNLKGISKDKLVEAHWNLDTGGKFSSWIVVEFDSADRTIVNKSLERLENKNAKVMKYSVEAGRWGYDTLIANILVKDVAHLTSVMENLRGMKGVQNVKRYGGVS
ncbi:MULTISPECIES: bifunctional (p)ppGpp synthetase/guanosine-3',5'-bis(diphosphate) 3'-pyrophosphohydrolase [Mesotoga]|uniref:(P)ppGpp synthetase, RelA/SpoT family n=1 Tax=Mesotoga prima MesG1.Ag.4.2 TaxID=660470 RepID=I2F6G1_9BACT|nr:MULTISPECIES: bifunctional (p)ppGpp synthetase/guanosine-3',5'-bis(diphosphate) 3'-pyrophosphohydrolase [Mesotoga]MCP5457806.1 bifunctional (p)ppGpp synthetase/guanosine-3',5'-bis(diphosphate) 3'-pyrophosphohydrolase [Thermotogota bacterium]CCU84616.1 (P)ppGpp synthetase I, SpoT/RelA [Mesotoga infera]AFK07514.1 (p)ppGpp synthetase, RelA/SpoT family [Mesotoga prima MesG1.Ag.4.2]MCP5461305.1 bifunctional (p)ppGpp synthetase/guanosine-3',5'-bis(diphosphate) 3'-pyrophosphohydrolase [Thermotogota